MTERLLDEMTVPELKVLARNAAIQGRSSMRKQELIDALKACTWVPAEPTAAEATQASLGIVPVTADEAEPTFARGDEVCLQADPTLEGTVLTDPGEEGSFEVRWGIPGEDRRSVEGPWAVRHLTADEAEELFTAEDEDPEFDPEAPAYDPWAEYIAAVNRQHARPSRTARRRLHTARKALPRARRRAERRGAVRAARSMRKILQGYRTNGVDSLLGVA